MKGGFGAERQKIDGDGVSNSEYSFDELLY